ncbi:predicted protein [Lichtheimia corymbifera JMRC:FSU:9682]|uniref:F-box domain-containing protein n=1 Tax=Lichtheimia corymbifera JMRC:FSU:9682 TaxID=1263082 RepID=A0A068SAN0_9FUNG|nr:predicted protein [Lichtheimia corymbifera JMRC:FSU:9682]
MREPQPIAIPQRHHVTETITDATRRLEESTQRRLVLLNDRARALAASAKFEAAMNDTTTMQTIAPSSGMGYLCAGHVHQLQGRHRACIAICDRGLSVVPSSDTYYQQLVDMRSMAVKHNSVYVDFIKELPGEIVEIIVDKLFTDGTRIGMDHLCQYLSISHIWRDTIVQSIRHLHLISEPGKDLVDSSGYILKHTAPYAAALTIKYEANSAYKLFQQYQFPSLRYLDLDEIYPEDTDTKTILLSLKLVQSTVTHLDIKMENLNYSLGDILDTFPHLVSLTCHDINNDLTTASEVYPRLKELKVWNEERGFRSYDLKTMTQRLPALEIFSVNPCLDTNALSMIQGNCPKLKLIAYNDYQNEESYMQRITYKGINNNNKSSSNNDLQSLNVNFVSGDTFDVDILDIITSITRNSHSLQSIFFCYNSKDNINTYLRIYEHVTLSHLTSYTHKISNDEHVQLALSVIQRSPHLRAIELFKGPGLSVDDDNDNNPHIYQDLNQVFIAISGLAYLEVADIRIKGGDAATGIDHFLRYHNSIDSRLRTLFVPKHSKFPLDTLKLLTGLPRLENLTLRLRTIAAPMDTMEEFVHKGRQLLESLARKCSLIHTLSLYDFHGFHLLSLRFFPRLKSLRLKLDHVNYPDLVVLLQCPELENFILMLRDPHKEMDEELDTLLKEKMRSYRCSTS